VRVCVKLGALVAYWLWLSLEDRLVRRIEVIALDDGDIRGGMLGRIS
jgi:hypothetical protein